MEKDKFQVTQITTKCLSQFSYFIQSGEESVVIDPLRDFQEITNLLASTKTTLKYIILSHFHADYVAGHFDLHAQTGAQILLGPCSLDNENVRYLGFRLALNRLWRQGSNVYLVLDKYKFGASKYSF